MERVRQNTLKWFYGAIQMFFKSVEREPLKLRFFPGFHKFFLPNTSGHLPFFLCLASWEQVENVYQQQVDGRVFMGKDGKLPDFLIFEATCRRRGSELVWPSDWLTDWVSDWRSGCCLRLRSCIFYQATLKRVLRASINYWVMPWPWVPKF